MPVKTAVVTGGLSYAGRYITKLLLQKGYTVRILTNHPGRENPFGAKVKMYPYSFDDEGRLLQQLSGAEVLVNTYWIRFDYSKKRFAGTFAKAVENIGLLVKLAKKAGVRRIIHISVTNPSINSKLPYFRSKAMAEQIIKRSGLLYTILRPALLFGNKEEILVNNISYLLKRYPIFLIPGSGEYKMQPIFVEDLASIAVGTINDSRSRIIDAIGPETFTYNQFIALLAEKLGSRALVVHVDKSVFLAMAKMTDYLMHDVVITKDETAGLMSGMLWTRSRPAGTTRFSEWAERNKNELGRSYHSEIERHFA